MDATIGEVTIEELKLFYAIDRDLYRILVMELRRNPAECMHIMGLWLWLERLGICNIVGKILYLTPSLINQLADEALICLKIVSNQFQISITTFEIPLTRILISPEFTLQYFHENQHSVCHAVQNLVSDVCIPALSDIMERVGVDDDLVGSSDQLTAGHESPACNQIKAAVSFGDCSTNSQTTTMPSRPTMGGGGSSVPNRASRYSRTMFATFSKGYPVSEQEVREFFTVQFGNCIESFHMQEVRSDKQQALYARIVFLWPSIIQMILNGGDKAKFTINGKHVWMRQFVPRGGNID